MQNIRKITNDLYYVGANDRRLALFENIYPIARGVSYNSYVMRDEKNVLLDTTDAAVGRQFMQNVEAALEGQPLHYLIVNHVEPDHSALIETLMLAHPETALVTNAKAAQMIRQFFTLDIDKRLHTVGEGDTLNTGRHTLHFVMAPMVHWPEVMVTYDEADRILFSADAFGSFGALDGHLYADQIDFDREWLDDARRYYTNIVGKYGAQVQATLKKASTLPIEMLCPLHGPIWRTAEGIKYLLGKYDLWSRYEAEDDGVLIVYGSIYGNTETAAELLAAKLAEISKKRIAIYDASSTDVSILVSETFRYRHLVVACATYNGALYSPIEHYFSELKSHNMQNRICALIENGTWAPTSGRLMRAALEQMKGMTLIDDNMTLYSTLKTDQMADIGQMAKKLIEA